MRIGAFEIQEPVPEFKDLHAIGILYPWVDAGSVGTLALEVLENHLEAKDLGKLSKPGTFFDFTRYRPTSQLVDGQRVLTVPNCNITYARTETGPDILFAHVMEPHAFAERYINSLVEVFNTLGVKRHCRISAMYNAVPHTRPLRVTGSPGVEKLSALAELVTPRVGGTYQGPTSIMNSMTDELEKRGIENLSFMVHLPHYLGLEEDYAGTARALEVLCALYNLPSHLADVGRGERQYREVGSEVEQNAQGKALLQRLEEYYDAQQPPAPTPQEDVPYLSPNIERFLNEIGQKLEDNT